MPSNPSHTKPPLKPLTVTIKQTEQITGLGTTTIYDLIKRGEYKTTKEGRRTLIFYDCLERRLFAARRGSAAPPGRPRKYPTLSK